MSAVRRIGLTGGIGSGKSTVAAVFKSLGAVLVDTDAIARNITAPGGAAMAAIASEFGRDMVTIDGALDRSRMRERAFKDPQAKARLESILHPLIGEQAQREAEAAGGRVVVFDVPLLTESKHWRSRVDRVVVVDCSVDTQIDRVSKRPGWTREAAALVVAQQATRVARRLVADAVIHNDGIDLQALQALVHALWAHWGLNER